jgi:hypothetical protein
MAIFFTCVLKWIVWAMTGLVFGDNLGLFSGIFHNFFSDEAHHFSKRSVRVQRVKRQLDIFLGTRFRLHVKVLWKRSPKG